VELIIGSIIFEVVVEREIILDVGVQEDGDFIGPAPGRRRREEKSLLSPI